MKSLALILIFFPFYASSMELHFGVLTKHIESSTYYDEKASNFYSERNVKYNEKNNLILAFNDDGIGLGTMINSYGKRSYLVQKKYSYLQTCGAIACNLSATLGLASGYYMNSKSGISPTLAVTTSANFRKFGANLSLFNFTALIGTVSYSF